MCLWMMILFDGSNTAKYCKNDFEMDTLRRMLFIMFARILGTWFQCIYLICSCNILDRTICSTGLYVCTVYREAKSARIISICQWDGICAISHYSQYKTDRFKS
eukprot:435781_1